MWNLGKVPSISTLHKTFYGELGRLGFRAHHVKQIYVYARAVVKAVKKSGGRKPILRRLTARLDKYDYRLDSDSRVLVLRVHDNKEVRLKLLVSSERAEKFKGWRNYELAMKVSGEGVYVAVYFKKIVKPGKPKTIATADINFDNVTLAVLTPSGKLVKLERFKTPLSRILTHRTWVERIQKRYPRSWRFIKRIGESIRKHGRRIRNIA